jgi:hypothetical protein
MTTISPGRNARSQHLLDIEPDAFTIDRAIDRPRRLNAIVTQRSQESHRLSSEVQHVGLQPRAARPRGGEGGKERMTVLKHTLEAAGDEFIAENGGRCAAAEDELGAAKLLATGRYRSRAVQRSNREQHRW